MLKVRWDRLRHPPRPFQCVNRLRAPTLHLSNLLCSRTSARRQLEKKCSKEDCPQGSDWENAKSMHNLCGLDIDGNEVPLEKYKGYVCLIVNLASNCGKTQVNYTELVEMHNNFADKGLRILGFPCNQFGGQEPGTDAEIKEFAKGYNVKFDMFSKIDVNGDNAHPLWKWMKRHPNGAGYLVNHIKWNFTKFLIDRNGQVAKRYGPNQDPSEVEKDLADYL
ncbi:phospholipid hydroperoxide glutathione peroxidase-like isoform X3 [Stigmatopora nigra]